MTLVVVGPKFEMPADGNGCGGDCTLFPYIYTGGNQQTQTPQLGQGRGADEDKSQSDDAKDRARTNGGLVKDQPATGPGTVPPDQRDPKRLWTKSERQKKLDQQGGKCPMCGEHKTVDETVSHHKKRHANGGKTNSENQAVVCKGDCHKKLHQPN